MDEVFGGVIYTKTRQERKRKENNIYRYQWWWTRSLEEYGVWVTRVRATSQKSSRMCSLTRMCALTRMCFLTSGSRECVLHLKTPLECVLTRMCSLIRMCSQNYSTAAFDFFLSICVVNVPRHWILRICVRCEQDRSHRPRYRVLWQIAHRRYQKTKKPNRSHRFHIACYGKLLTGGTKNKKTKSFAQIPYRVFWQITHRRSKKKIKSFAKKIRHTSTSSYTCYWRSFPFF